MGTGKRGEHQLAGVGLALRHVEPRDPLVNRADRLQVGEIQAGRDAVAVEVQRDGDDVEIAGALAVAEERAFHAVGAGQQAEFGGGHAGAAVVVGVQRDDDGLAVFQVAAHPLDLVGMDVRRGPLDGGRQVEDHFLLRRRLPDVDHRVAALEREIQFGVRKRFGRILQHHLGVAARWGPVP